MGCCSPAGHWQLQHTPTDNVYGLMLAARPSSADVLHIKKPH
jgi:hypothetical protein